MTIHPTTTSNTDHFTSQMWLIHEASPILSTYSLMDSLFPIILVNLEKLQRF